MARGRRRPLLLGVLAVGYGSNFVVTNLWPSDARWPLAPLVAYVAANTLAFVGAAGLARDVVRGNLGRQSRALVATVAAIAAVSVLAIARNALQAEDFVGATAIATATPAQALAFRASSAMLFVGVGALVAACAFAYSGAAPRARHALAALAAGFGAWPAFYAPILSVGPTGDPSGFLPAVVLASASWVAALGNPDGGLARRTLFGLLGLGVLGAALGTFFGFGHGSDYGTPGILRCAAVALLATTVFRHDLLGVPLPRFAVSRGPVAAGALAALFVVAQVAQNFFSAQFGLLMGGVVAGAFLFAAQPIQRAMERAGAAAGSGAAAPPSDAARRETAYLDACRLAMRDRRLTRDEEGRLHRLADELRLAPSRAHELLVQAEREAGVA